MITDNTTMERIIDAEWKRLELFCGSRAKDGHCGNRLRESTACTKVDCPCLRVIACDIAMTDRQCYRDKKGFHIYVERFAHNVRPWFIWHEEPCAFPPGARSVGGDVTLAGAQAKLDRMAARYGWEQCEMPGWVRDEEG